MNSTSKTYLKTSELNIPIYLNPNKKQKFLTPNIRKKYISHLTPLPVHIAKLKTGLIYDPRTEKHQPFSSRHGIKSEVENPLRTINIINQLTASKVINDDIEFITEVDKLKIETATSVHGTDYVEIIESFWPEGLDKPQMKYKDTYYTKFSFEAALRSAESVRLAVQKVVNEEWKNAFALSRPPGHHAQKDNRMSGFCFLNNAVIAAKEAINKMGVKKVLILDWDVHHGDSTQKLLYDDDSILYISLHRFDKGKFFPGESGDVKNLGEGKGKGFNLNFPFDVDEAKEEIYDDSFYTYVFDNAIWPVCKAFGPELVIVSCGLDCLFGDPLGRIQLSGDGNVTLSDLVFCNLRAHPLWHPSVSSHSMQYNL